MAVPDRSRLGVIFRAQAPVSRDHLDGRGSIGAHVPAMIDRAAAEHGRFNGCYMLAVK